ncbi:hypothetical protein [Acidithiobacillus thiooxidans]|uniref:hypothetical protein n=1 Tax=Acidithiobacillus thiooxidans TaxID=930 RepID=UPI001C073EFE|nr:hypothetical protein [Acidithiobacillus thiooxidans]MBU2842582.1 hypothetical protein [Acidithiobacillus thiooxidans]
MSEKEIKTRMKPMPIDRLSEIDQRIRKLGENGAPSVIPGRLVPDAVARKVARTMAYHHDIPDADYVHELIAESIAPTTARRIVKKARAMAATIEVPVMIHQPAASPAPAPVVAPAPVTAPTSGGVMVVGKEKGAEAAAKPVPAPTQPEPAIQLRNGDENQAGDVWIEKAQKYVPKSKLISGFRKLNGDVWDAEKGEFIPGNSIKHGHVRVEDGWEWHSSLRMYRNPDRNVPDPWESDDPEINRLYRD